MLVPPAPPPPEHDIGGPDFGAGEMVGDGIGASEKEHVVAPAYACKPEDRSSQDAVATHCLDHVCAARRGVYA